MWLTSEPGLKRAPLGYFKLHVAPTRSLTKYCYESLQLWLRSSRRTRLCLLAAAPRAVAVADTYVALLHLVFCANHLASLHGIRLSRAREARHAFRP